MYFLVVGGRSEVKNLDKKIKVNKEPDAYMLQEHTRINWVFNSILVCRLASGRAWSLYSRIRFQI